MAIPCSPSGQACNLRVAFVAVALSLCLSVVVAQNGFAGMVIHEETAMTGMPTPPDAPAGTKNIRSTVLYLEGKKIRTETDKLVFILDFEAGKIVTLNPVAKSYTEVGLEQLREAQKQAVQWMANLREQMKKNLATLPPEKQAEMQKKIDALPQDLVQPEKPAKVSIKATGKGEKINGFPAREYELYEDGEKTALYWLTTEVSNKPFDLYQTELSKWMEGMASLGGDRLREWPHVRDQGFPVRIERIKPLMGKVLYTWDVKQVEEESIADSLFQVPEGYKRSETPALPGGPPPALPPGPGAGKPEAGPSKPEGQGG